MQEAKQPFVRNPCIDTCDEYSLCVLSPEGPKCICEDGSVLSGDEECDEANLVVSPAISPRYVQKRKCYGLSRRPSD